ncbi:MAG: MFS transporter [candidate division KSB1 bacterium]|nr:MFS transporter [candidate division KSB1 bacterium]
MSLFFLGLTDVQVIPVLLPAFESGFSVSIAMAGSLVTLYSLAAALSALVVGPLSDRFGRMRFIRAGAGLFALAALLGAMADRFWGLAVARMMAGAAGGIFSTCIVALIADRFTFERRGRAMGWVAGMYSLAAVAGVPTGAFVASAFGWRVIFWGFGLLALLLSLILPRINDPQLYTGLAGPLGRGGLLDSK